MYFNLTGGVGLGVFVKESGSDSSGWGAIGTFAAVPTTGQVPYGDSAGRLTFSANLTFDGTNLTDTGTVTAGQLTISTAVGKIVPGATSLSHRNHADSADNLLISDAGVVTVRSTLSLGGFTAGTFQQKEASIATNGTSLVAVSAVLTALVFVLNTSTGDDAIFGLRGGNNATYKIADPGATFSNTKDNANTTNVCWDPASGYIIQQKRGATETFKWWVMAGG